MKNVLLFEAIATMVGTIIGAGILGIPYVFAQNGFWTGTLVLLVVALAMMLMKTMYGEVTLRTRGEHQLAGYTEKYLGKRAKHLMTFVLIFSLYGALLAYLIGQGEVIEAITGIPQFWGSIGFLALFSFLIFVGLSIIKRAELLMTAIIMGVVTLIWVLSHNHINLQNLQGFDITKFLAPYGVLLFATSGIVAVPEVRQILKKNEGMMKKAIILGCAIPPIVYFLFAFLIVSISGMSVTEVATIGLGDILGWKMILIGNVFAFFTMATSFLTIGLAVMTMYKCDYKIPKFVSWLLAMSVPLAVFLLGERNFIEVISVIGALGIGIAGILEVITYFVARKKGKRKPEYVIPGWLGYSGGTFIIILFVLGVIYTVMSLI